MTQKYWPRRKGSCPGKLPMCKRGSPWFGDQCPACSEVGVWVSIGAPCNIYLDAATPWLCRTWRVNWEWGPWSQFTALTLGSAVQVAIWGRTQRKAWGYQERESWMNESVRWMEREQPGEEMAMKISSAGGGKIEKGDRKIAGKMGKR